MAAMQSAKPQERRKSKKRLSHSSSINIQWHLQHHVLIRLRPITKWR